MISRVTERAERKVNASDCLYRVECAASSPTQMTWVKPFVQTHTTTCFPANAYQRPLDLPHGQCFHDFFDLPCTQLGENTSAAPQRKRKRTFCCSVVLLRCIHGAAWQRLSLAELVVNMKVTLLSPPKMCSSLCFSSRSSVLLPFVRERRFARESKLQKEISVEVHTWVQQKIDSEIRQLSYPFFNFPFNSTKLIQLTCLDDSCNNLSTALIWL